MSIAARKTLSAVILSTEFSTASVDIPEGDLGPLSIALTMAGDANRFAVPEALMQRVLCPPLDCHD